MVSEMLTPYLYRVQDGREVSVVNHGKLMLCRDKWNALPAWVRRMLSAPEDTGGEKFYICRLPDDGKLMIQCDECLDWFHGSCVGVDKKKARNIKRYFRPICSSQSYHLTIFLSLYHFLYKQRMANFVNEEDVRWFEHYMLFKSMFNKTYAHFGRGDQAKNADRPRPRSRSPIAVIHDHARSTEGQKWRV